MIRLIASFLILLISGMSAHAAEQKNYTLTGHLTQGGLVIGKTQPGSTIFLEGNTVQIAEDGTFVFGFGRDFKSTARLEIQLPGGQHITEDLAITPRTYRVEKVDGLPPSKVTPSEAVLERIRRENAEIAKIRQINSPEKWFQSGWAWPALGRVSGVYGSQRVLNGVPKRPHFGLDVAAPVGTEVRASTDGMVRLVEADLFYTGGTIMIDHGFGLISVYSHLSKTSVKPGDFVQQGQKIGEVGATGRSSGPHLDWRLNWLNERLDPELLLGPMPKGDS